MKDYTSKVCSEQPLDWSQADANADKILELLKNNDGIMNTINTDIKRMIGYGSETKHIDSFINILVERGLATREPVPSASIAGYSGRYILELIYSE